MEYLDLFQKNYQWIITIMALLIYPKTASYT
ncbi:mechanosensitive ion channel family protein, partial [Vibrio sp. V22_P2S10T140]|nr:mechanosensitive ion channel family protein [Vibrio sp. V22_P2S10T140]